MATLMQNVNPGLLYEAQLGNKGSIDRLTELAQERLFPYIYRLTLDQSAAEDIMQETILFMLQSLGRLEEIEHFWHWMFRTAHGKVQHFFRERQRRRTVELSEEERLYIHHRVSADLNDGLTEMLRKELSSAVFKGMKRLKLRYRNVIILRCFENLEYAEMAQLMNISELHAGVLFFRAKNSLRRKLAVQGFGRRYFLVALALFGLVTTSAKAASSSFTISVASLEAGFAASFAAAISSKIGILTTAGLAALFFTLPVETFLYVLAFCCFAGICIFLIALFDIYS